MAPPPQLVLTPEQVTEIVAHALAESPAEACGLLGGRDGHAERVYPLPNVEGSSTRYLAEPQAQVDAMMEIEEQGWEIVAIYHSHLNAPALPSATDLEMAFFPDSLYLIISVADQGRPVLRAFRIEKRQIEEVEILIAQSFTDWGRSQDRPGTFGGGF